MYRRRCRSLSTSTKGGSRAFSVFLSPALKDEVQTECTFLLKSPKDILVVSLLLYFIVL